MKIKEIRHLLILVTIIVCATSCHNVKEVKAQDKEHTTKEVHHYRDSIMVVERIFKDTLVVQADSSMFRFHIDELKRLGELNHSQGRIHTKIIKDDFGMISVHNTIDSLIHIIEHSEKETYRLRTQVTSLIDQYRSEKETEIVKKKKSWRFLYILIPIVLVAIFFLFKIDIISWLKNLWMRISQR